MDKIWIHDWKQRKLGEIVNRITRKNSKLISELPLTISAQQGLIDQNEFFDKRVVSKDVSGYYLIKNGKFAYNKSTGIHEIAAEGARIHVHGKPWVP